MEEPVRWVSKVEAAEELEVSLSTLDRMIRRGEVVVRREGRRVYVRMQGPEYLSDEELLRRSVAREEELQRTVRELEQSVSQWQLRASELERERDEARESAATANRPYHELERGVPEGGCRAQGDQGCAHHSPRNRHRAVGAADRDRPPVVVRAEVGTHAPGWRRMVKGSRQFPKLSAPRGEHLQKPIAPHPSPQFRYGLLDGPRPFLLPDPRPNGTHITKKKTVIAETPIIIPTTTHS